MDTRVAVISIIVEQEDAIEELNTLLHEARQYIVGRMGIPYRPKGISIISIAIDAPQDVISALSGKIGRLKGVSAKRHTRMLLLRQREEQNSDQDSSLRKRWNRKIHHGFQCGSGSGRDGSDGDADRL